jgi:hypothetical protein
VGILNRLRKCRQEGMVISIVEALWLARFSRDIVH